MMGNAFGDVYVDDLIILILSASIDTPTELGARLGATDEAYRDLGLPVKHRQGRPWVHSFYFLGWRAPWVEGIFGAPMSNRAELMGVTLHALSRSISKDAYQQIISFGVYTVGFRRGACCLGRLLCAC